MLSYPFANTSIISVIKANNSLNVFMVLFFYFSNSGVINFSGMSDFNLVIPVIFVISAIGIKSVATKAIPKQ